MGPDTNSGFLERLYDTLVSYLLHGYTLDPRDLSLRGARNSWLYFKLFGDWEQHTKAFGSRMMNRMGYRRGEGLGKEKQVKRGQLENMHAFRAVGGSAAR